MLLHLSSLVSCVCICTLARDEKIRYHNHHLLLSDCIMRHFQMVSFHIANCGLDSAAASLRLGSIRLLLQAPLAASFGSSSTTDTCRWLLFTVRILLSAAASRNLELRSLLVAHRPVPELDELALQPAMVPRGYAAPVFQQTSITPNREQDLPESLPSCARYLGHT